MYKSIVQSCDTYYYVLANDMGVDLMHDELQKFGFGAFTGIDIQGEVRGLLPSTEWKRKAYKRPEQQKWYAGETISLGIGQGYNNFTMLQLALATGVIANDGIKMKPHLVKEVVDVVTRTHPARLCAKSRPRPSPTRRNIAVIQKRAGRREHRGHRRHGVSGALATWRPERLAPHRWWPSSRTRNTTQRAWPNACVTTPCTWRLHPQTSRRSRWPWWWKTPVSVARWPHPLPAASSTTGCWGSLRHQKTWPRCRRARPDHRPARRARQPRPHQRPRALPRQRLPWQPPPRQSGSQPTP
jgi:hypothetical protein